jgi:non-ribosomal peptide synthetase component E (peptide arylation enzyme)
MPSLKDFEVDRNKVWFTEGYWPEGVPKQLYDVDGVIIEPMFDGFIRNANDNDLWDDDICMAVFGPHIQRITYKKLIEYAKKFGSFLYNLGVRKGDTVAIDLPN